ncbi:MAG: 50S ribosomal protein L25 [Armatimonadota bacterium]
MEQFAISASKRDNVGTGAARAYRREGLIPGTVYGQGQAATSIVVNAKELQSFMRSHGSLASLNIEGDTSTDAMGVLIQETQRHPISREILSVDFLWVNLKETVHVNVPVVLVGEAPGVKVQAGSLDQTLYEVTVACLPTAIPESIEADISGLHTGQSLHVRDIVVPEGVTFITSLDEAVAVVTKGIKSEDLEVQVEGEVSAEEAEGEAEAEAESEE